MSTINFRMVVFGILCMAAISLSSCAPKLAPYSLRQEEPANYITNNRSVADVVTYSEAACPKDQPSEASAMGYLKAFLKRGHRRTGTPEARCAAAYVRDTLAGMGYTVTEQPYRFPYYQFDPGKVSVVRERDGRAFEAYPALTSRSRMDKPAKGQVVKFGKKTDLKGKFVYMTVTDLLSDYQGLMSEQAIQKLKDRGAIGIILDSDLSVLFPVSPDYPWAAILNPSWRYTPLPSWIVVKAGELIGETVTAYQDGRIVAGTGFNVIATKGKRADSYVLITAHIDSWFEGAWDDGTGIAALLEAARLMKDDADGLIFLAVDGEEPGLIGSSAYVRQFGTANVKAVIELDGISTIDNGKGANPAIAKPARRSLYSTSGFAKAVRQAQKGFKGRDQVVPLSMFRFQYPFNSSDLWWFEGEGVPGVWMFSKFNYYYHTRGDTLNWIPADDLQQATLETVALARGLRQSQPFGRPKNILDLAFEVSPGAGDTINFKATSPTAGNRAKVTVGCFFENGFEQNMDLERQPDGSFRGSFRIPWPGEWEFLAVAESGNKFAKRWAVLTSR